MDEWRGAPVAAAIADECSEQINRLGLRGIKPVLAVVRVGNRADDLSYERGIQKRFSALGAEVHVTELPNDVSQQKLEQTVEALNRDSGIHGILVFRPLPAHLSEPPLKSIIREDKDVDCMGYVNMARLFSAEPNGIAPCTAQAVMELLKYYNAALDGKKVTVVGRSVVIGKPVAMLLMQRNATVTVCHTRTVNLADECRRADILVACAGAAGMITREFTNRYQIIVDVGINVLDGKLCGDADFSGISGNVRAMTPVPGGVGAVTTSVLLKHTVICAEKLAGISYTN